MFFVDNDDIVAVYAFGIARKVLYYCCLCELSAHLHAAIFYRVQVGAGSIDGSRIACRSATDNQTFYVFHIRLFRLSAIR